MCTSVESFYLVYKYLWNSTIKAKLNIPDTILFRNGRRYMWIFTSEKTGQVMKKDSPKLNSIEFIIKSFKAKSFACNKLKRRGLESRIAIIWYLQSDKELASFLVDEKDLYTVLNGLTEEVVAIQVYTGGITHSPTGNGLYEVRYD